jgi:hypothetical protein
MKAPFGGLIALILVLSPAMAADKDIATTTIPFSMLVQLPDHSYTFEPKDDITAPELAQIIKILMPAMVCHNVLGCDVLPQIDALPDNIRRHFAYHKER